MGTEKILGILEIPFQSGDIIEYASICRLLNEEELINASEKEEQLTHWKLFFSYKQKGENFLVEKIYSPIYAHKNTMNQYMSSLKADTLKLIHYSVLNSNGEKAKNLHFTERDILESTSFCNVDYFGFINKQAFFSIVTNTDIEAVEHFYDVSYCIIGISFFASLLSIEGLSIQEFIPSYSKGEGIYVIDVLDSDYSKNEKASADEKAIVSYRMQNAEDTQQKIERTFDMIQEDLQKK